MRKVLTLGKPFFIPRKAYLGTVLPVFFSFLVYFLIPFVDSMAFRFVDIKMIAVIGTIIPIYNLLNIVNQISSQISTNRVFQREDKNYFIPLVWIFSFTLVSVLLFNIVLEYFFENTGLEPNSDQITSIRVLTLALLPLSILKFSQSVSVVVSKAYLSFTATAIVLGFTVALDVLVVILFRGRADLAVVLLTSATVVASSIGAFYIVVMLWEDIRPRPIARLSTLVIEWNILKTSFFSSAEILSISVWLSYFMQYVSRSGEQFAINFNIILIVMLIPAAWRIAFSVYVQKETSEMIKNGAQYEILRLVRRSSMVACAHVFGTQLVAIAFLGLLLDGPFLVPMLASVILVDIVSVLGSVANSALQSMLSTQYVGTINSVVAVASIVSLTILPGVISVEPALLVIFAVNGVIRAAIGIGLLRLHLGGGWS